MKKNVIFPQRIEKRKERLQRNFFLLLFLQPVASLLGWRVGAEGRWWGGEGWVGETGSPTESTHNGAPICHIISQCGGTKVFIGPNFIHEYIITVLWPVLGTSARRRRRRRRRRGVWKTDNEAGILGKFLQVSVLCGRVFFISMRQNFTIKAQKCY